MPVVGRLERFGQPWLVVCETAFCLPDAGLPDGAPSEDPFDLRPLRCQLGDPERTLFSNDWGRACARVLTAEDAPRWLLLLAGSRVGLLDRNTYAQGRYLAFDLDDAYGRREPDTFAHVAAFLAAETLCAAAAEVIHDQIEQQSHRFADRVFATLGGALLVRWRSPVWIELAAAAQRVNGCAAGVSRAL